MAKYIPVTWNALTHQEALDYIEELRRTKTRSLHLFVTTVEVPMSECGVLEARHSVVAFLVDAGGGYSEAIIENVTRSTAKAFVNDSIRKFRRTK